MASFDEIVSKMTAAIKGVREAVLGKDVREFIASGYESVLDTYKQLNTAITEAIDPTLSLSGKAADAKATGAAVDKLEDKKADKTALDTERKRIDVLNEGGLNLKNEVIDTSIKSWLADHPEATTTVNYNITTKVYETLSSLKTDTTLALGDKCKTLGYDAINDGGAAYYKIISKNTPLCVETENKLYAEMILSEKINIKQIGGKSEQDTDFSHYDNKKVLDKYIEIIKYKKNKITLYIPDGIWCFSPTVIQNDFGFDILGESGYLHYARALTGTIICPKSDSQPYIWKIGGDSNYQSVQQSGTTNFSIKNIGFTTFRFSSITYSDYQYHTTYGALIFDSCQFGYVENLNLHYIVGTALCIRQSWEINFNYVMIRCVADFSKPCVLFDAHTGTTISGSPNITAINFEYLGFEACNGDLIETSPKSNFSHNHIGTINIENAFYSINIDKGNAVKLTQNESVETYKKQYVLNLGSFSCSKIDFIQMQRAFNYKYVSDENVYISAISKIKEKSPDLVAVDIGEINIEFPDIAPTVLSAENTVNKISTFSVSCIKISLGDTHFEKPEFEIECFPFVYIGNIIMGYRKNDLSVNLTARSEMLSTLKGIYPLYKLATLIQSTDYYVGGCVSYDRNALSSTGLVVKKTSLSTYPHSIPLGVYNGERIYLRAKTTDSKNAYLILTYTSDGQEKNTTTIINNQTFEWVELKTSTITDGSEISLDTNSSAVFDVIRFN